jgi:hypothetical protein
MFLSIFWFATLSPGQKRQRAPQSMHFTERPLLRVKSRQKELINYRDLLRLL